MDRFIQFAMMAADEAIAQSGWKPGSERDKERTATIIASGIGGFPTIVEAVRTTDERGVRRLSPFTVPSKISVELPSAPCVPVSVPPELASDKVALRSPIGVVMVKFQFPSTAIDVSPPVKKRARV